MKKLLCVVLVVLVTLLSPTMIFAQETNNRIEIDRETLRGIKEDLRKYEVPENAINHLIKKLKKGEVWDSMSGEYADLEPQIVEAGYSKTIYPDGSIKVIQVEATDQTEIIYEEEMSIKAISGGTYYSGSGYAVMKNAKISASTTLIKMSFYADYGQYSNQTSNITAVRDESILAFLFNVSDIELSITRQNGSGDIPATARLRAQASSQFAGGSATIWLQLNVLYNRAWTTDAI